MGAILVLFGIACVSTGVLWPGGATKMLFPTLSGICIASFSALPYKEIMTRQERIEMVEGIRCQLATTSDEDRAHMDELAWKVIEKGLLG
jgi:hypothetical protein